MKEAKTPDNQSRLLKVGLIGTVIAALCCFTPVLVILFGAVGLSAMLGWLAVFIGITVYALWKSRNSETPS